jgi:hypothetical protein
MTAETGGRLSATSKYPIDATPEKAFSETAIVALSRLIPINPNWLGWMLNRQRLRRHSSFKNASSFALPIAFSSIRIVASALPQ